MKRAEHDKDDQIKEILGYVFVLDRELQPPHGAQSGGHSADNKPIGPAGMGLSSIWWTGIRARSPRLPPLSEMWRPLPDLSM